MVSPQTYSNHLSLGDAVSWTAFLQEASTITIEKARAYVECGCDFLGAKLMWSLEDAHVRFQAASIEPVKFIPHDSLIGSQAKKSTFRKTFSKMDFVTST